MPAAALFDHDGLTTDTEPVWTRAEATLFARHGIDFTIDHKRELLGSSPDVAAVKLEALLGAPGDDLADELYALTLAELAAGAEPRPGVVELLDALRSAGIAVAVVSNSRGGFLRAALRAAGLHDAFGVVVSADDVGAPKPAPDAYLAAADALGAERARCVVLEDSPTGIAAGRAAGMATIGVPSVDGVVLDADVVAASLADPTVWSALGLARPAT